MADPFTVDATELFQLAQNCEVASRFVPQEMQRAITRSVLQIEKDAKGLAPVFTGHLRRSITHEVEARQSEVVGRVGTNVPYAKAVEFGTGLLSEAPDSGHRRYMPPPAALDAWAIAKGFTVVSARTARGHAAATPGVYGQIVAWAIYLRGGTKPKPYLRPALKDNLPNVEKEIKAIVPRILAKLAGK